MACTSVWACSASEKKMIMVAARTLLKLRLNGVPGFAFSFSNGNALLNHRAGHIRRARRVVVDLARLVREKPPLPGSPHLVRHGGDSVGADRAIDLFSRSVRKGVAALAAAGQVGVDGLLAAALRSA